VFLFFLFFNLEVKSAFMRRQLKFLTRQSVGQAHRERAEFLTRQSVGREHRECAEY
jgi:hypothetical protein